MFKGRAFANIDSPRKILHADAMAATHNVPHRPVIIIPARMNSTRLPGKPLADIGGQPMIVRVWQQAMASMIGPVIVACDGADIATVIEKAGGIAVVTRPDHSSGSDRIWEALQVWEKREAAPQGYDAIINLQGDLPLIDPAAIRTAFKLLENPAIDIATLAVEIDNEIDKHAPQIVKAAFNQQEGASHGRALYFSRLPVPAGNGPLYHHVGLYAYRREALAAFVAAPPAPLERRESLEQLRALALGLHIEVGVIDSLPLGVDTPEDLEKARRLMAELQER